MHETQEKLKDDQLERELAEMELETLKLEALHDYEEAIHQKNMDEGLWTIIIWKEIYSIYYWSKLQALLRRRAMAKLLKFKKKTYLLDIM